MLPRCSTLDMLKNILRIEAKGACEVEMCAKSARRLEECAKSVRQSFVQLEVKAVYVKREVVAEKDIETGSGTNKK
jgi:hypothetical protein